MARINIGHIIGPFGLKGEVKIHCDSNHIEKIFKYGNSLYIDNQKYIIQSYRKHKNIHLVAFEGLDDINKINSLLKKDVYVGREDLDLQEDEYLYIELLGYEIYDQNENIGKVESLLMNKKNIFIKTGNLIIPLVPKYLIKVDTLHKMVYVSNSKELIL